MKLDYDYVRELLLAYEDSSELSGPSDKDLINLTKKLDKTRADLVYTIKKLSEGKFVTTQIILGIDNSPQISSGNLTFKGHQYLDNIRDTKVWKETKKATSNLASVSLEIISSVAAKVIANSLNL